MTPANLTRREREVAMLVAEGLTNRAIAAQLFISERTAEFHVEQLRGKLGFRSRAQVAAWVTAQGLDREVGPPSSAEPAGSGALSSEALHRRRVVRPVSVAVGAGVVLVIALAAGFALNVRYHPATTVGEPSIETVAGTGVAAFSNDGGRASASALVRPVAVMLGTGGEVYIAEGNRIREVQPDGRITTLAGTGTAGSDGDGGPAARAQLNSPQGIALDSASNIYIADTLGNRVRRVGADGVITTVAGTGEPGYTGDGQPGREAKLNLPTGLAIGFGDSLFIADTGNNVIRRLGPDGIITSLAGTGEAGYRGDGGPASFALLHAPGGVAFDNEGNLYIADALNERIRKIDVNGQISTVVGTGAAGARGDGGPAIFAELNLANNPTEGMGQGLAVGPRGDVLIADALNLRIRRLELNGVISTVVRVGTPLGVAVDPQGTVYIADARDNRVSRVR